MTEKNYDGKINSGISVAYHRKKKFVVKALWEVKFNSLNNTI